MFTLFILLCKSQMAIRSMSRAEFLAGIGTERHWDVSDNLDVSIKIPHGTSLVGVFVLDETHSEWKNVSNTQLTYKLWESAKTHHAGCVLRPLYNGYMWPTVMHPVGDVYVVYT